MDFGHGHPSERWQFACVHIRQENLVVWLGFVHETVSNDSFTSQCRTKFSLSLTVSIVCVGRWRSDGYRVTRHGLQVRTHFWIVCCMLLIWVSFSYSDLLQNPLIVPLKKLQSHQPHDDFGIFDVMWHPTQPWVFSAGADSTVRLYT